MVAATTITVPVAKPPCRSRAVRVEFVSSGVAGRGAGSISRRRGTIDNRFADEVALLVDFHTNYSCFGHRD